MLERAFDPAGRRLVSVALDGSMRIWSVEHGVEVFSLSVGRHLRAVTIAPDGSSIVFAVDKVAVVLDIVDPRSKRAAALLANVGP